MDNKPEDISKILESTLWSIFLGSFYTLFVGVILTLGYLFLEDDIHAYFNQKTYSEKELEQMLDKALERQYEANETANWDKVVNGIHIRTGLHADPNLSIIIGSCTSCHSAKLITQNKATREGWKNMIRWMQKTQGLPDLGESEPIVLNYLAKYYAPKNTGRRKNIDIEAIEWYILNTAQTTQ